MADVSARTRRAVKLSVVTLLLLPVLLGAAFSGTLGEAFYAFVAAVLAVCILGVALIVRRFVEWKQSEKTEG